MEQHPSPTLRQRRPECYSASQIRRLVHEKPNCSLNSIVQVSADSDEHTDMSSIPLLWHLRKLKDLQLASCWRSKRVQGSIIPLPHGYLGCSGPSQIVPDTCVTELVLLTFWIPSLRLVYQELECANKSKVESVHKTWWPDPSHKLWVRLKLSSFRKLHILFL